jgi:hypothetical protein
VSLPGQAASSFELRKVGMLILRDSSSGLLHGHVEGGEGLIAYSDVTMHSAAKCGSWQLEKGT